MLTKLFVASAALLALMPAAGASAGVVPTSGEGCPDQTFTQAFAQFGDRHLYTAVPNGSFENGTTGWQITGDAAVVPHVNPFRPNPGTGALMMGPGSVATSPPVCVTRHYPSARTFLQKVSGGLLSRVGVEVLYPARVGRTATRKPAGFLGGSALFGPSRRFSIAQGLFGRGPVEIRIRLSVRGTGTFLIDDLLVDPRCRS